MMAITEADRLQLHQAMKQLIGKEADTLMTALPRDQDNLATKDDVRNQGADLRTEMAELRVDLRTEMADIRVEMAEMGSSLRTEFHEATAGQTRTLMFGLAGTVMTMSVVQLVSVLAVS
jgi:hypothetical protein